MPIEFVCSGCSNTLRVPDAHAGKHARCPQCSSVNPIPAQPAESVFQAETANSESTDEKDDGIQFADTSSERESNPDKAQQESAAPQSVWDGTRESDSEFTSQSSGSEQAQNDRNQQDEQNDSVDLFGALASDTTNAGEPNSQGAQSGYAPSSNSPSQHGGSYQPHQPTSYHTNQFSQPSHPSYQAAQPPHPGYPPGQQPGYHAPGYPGQYNAPGYLPHMLPHRGSVILTMGILGLVCNVLLIPGLIALFMGMSDVREIKRGAMDPSGLQTTQAGMVLGIVGTAIYSLGFLMLLSFMIFS